ncbi:MAG: hypothetical protein QNJ54_34940 [Prochloraceae cyanobacterium]|nr:hypothetical protein [Prochloraceae cyanobacterium]
MLSLKNAEKLMTGLVVASAAQIKILFGEVFGMRSERLDSLQLQPGTIGVIHYPNSEHPPIVQAINILGFNPASNSQQKLLTPFYSSAIA